MKILFLILSIPLFICSSKEKHDYKRLSVFFMDKFENDSVQVQISKTNTSYLRLTTDKSIGGCKEGLLIDRNYSDKKLLFTNIKQKVVDSIEIDNEFEFLYVYFRTGKFMFRFEKKQLNLE